MDKVRIQEIALEAGLSNNELLDKAKELGFEVKAANSAISMDEAGILVDYAISGTLPKGFKKPEEKKPKIKVVKKEETKSVEPSEETAENTEVKTEVAEEQVATVEKSEPETLVAEEKPAPKKVAKKRKGISVVTPEEEPTAQIRKASEEESPVKKTLSRGGIKIVRKAKPEPVKVAKKISLDQATTEPVASKKKPKKAAEARETGEKLDIFNGDISSDISSGFGDEEVVLLDFSDKNIYEEMQRQEQKRKEEAKKRENAGVMGGKTKQAFRKGLRVCRKSEQVCR